MDELCDGMLNLAAGPGVEESGISLRSSATDADELASIPRPRWFKISKIRSVDLEGTSLFGTGGRSGWPDPIDCTLGMSLSRGSHDIWAESCDVCSWSHDICPDVDWRVVSVLRLSLCEEEAWSPLLTSGKTSFALGEPRSGKWRGEGRLFVGEKSCWWWRGLLKWVSSKPTVGSLYFTAVWDHYGTHECGHLGVS